MKTKHKNRVSLYLTDETLARLIACQNSIRTVTGLPYVALCNVASLAVEHGLKHMAEDQEPSS
jgi:hypothetical protein